MLSFASCKLSRSVSNCLCNLQYCSNPSTFFSTSNNASISFISFDITDNFHQTSVNLLEKFRITSKKMHLTKLPKTSEGSFFSHSLKLVSYLLIKSEDTYLQNTLKIKTKKFVMLFSTGKQWVGIWHFLHVLPFRWWWLGVVQFLAFNCLALFFERLKKGLNF